MGRLPLPPAESLELLTLAEIARGGMGTVELCRVTNAPRMGQVLAIKRLHPYIAEDSEFVAMFFDEACLTAALQHINVVGVVAWGEDGRGKYLGMEAVQGVSLSRLLKEAKENKEAFAERSVAFLCSQICAGLIAAHTLKAPDGTLLPIVHRDLTPANVLVTFEGLVKIIDFGIAKAEERITHTRTGQIKGKPQYMAPEQHRGGPIDARADIFSFGILMFELLAGRRPWMAKGAFDVMMEIAQDPHPDLGELRKGLNPAFVAIVHKCLQKKPEDRFETVAEIKTQLDAWLAAKGFSVDDQPSLANFVRRNSTRQIKWWEDALRGEIQQQTVQTFKELEEKIDEERAKVRKEERAKKAAIEAPLTPSSGAGHAGVDSNGPGSGPGPSSVRGGPSSGGASGSAPIPVRPSGAVSGGLANEMVHASPSSPSFRPVWIAAILTFIVVLAGLMAWESWGKHRLHSGAPPPSAASAAP